jgi:hypothetical protein
MHQHPNNFLSGVYYVRTHPGADTINFHDPRNQTGIIRTPVVELTAENIDQVVVRVKDGTMLVFPAYLQHSVDASASEDERISISFNIMFSSIAENLSKPLWRAAAAFTRAGAQSSALPRFVKHAVLTRVAHCRSRRLSPQSPADSHAVGSRRGPGIGRSRRLCRCALTRTIGARAVTTERAGPSP